MEVRIAGPLDLTGSAPIYTQTVAYTCECERSPISVLTELDVEQLCWWGQRRYHYAKPPPLDPQLGGGGDVSLCDSLVRDKGPSNSMPE